jgi:hypothetical protein
MYKQLPQVSSFVEPCLWQRRIMDPSPDKQATHVVSDPFLKNGYRSAWPKAALRLIAVVDILRTSPSACRKSPSSTHWNRQADIRADQGLSWHFGISRQEVAFREDHRFFFAGTDCVQT